MNLLLAMVLALPSGQTIAAPDPAIEAARRASVQEMDQALPKESLETWLRRLVGPDAPMRWEVNDCGEQTGSRADRGRVFPKCVGVTVDLPNDRRLLVLIVVGTWANDTLRPAPLFHSAVVSGPDENQATWAKTLGQVPLLVGAAIGYRSH